MWTTASHPSSANSVARNTDSESIIITRSYAPHRKLDLSKIKCVSDHWALRLFKDLEKLEPGFLSDPEGCRVFARDPEDHLAHSTDAPQINTHETQRS